MKSKNSREDHGKKRQTKIQKGYQDSSFNSDSRSLGDASSARTKIGDDKIGISGEVSQRRNSSESSFGGQILGGTISQLIEKAEGQLAVLEESAIETS